MDEYLEQAIINAIVSMGNNGRPIENDGMWIVDEDDDVWYMEGRVNGLMSRWVIDKPNIMVEAPI